MGKVKGSLLEEFQSLDSGEVLGKLFEEDIAKKLSLKEEFLHKVREDEIK